MLYIFYNYSMGEMRILLLRSVDVLINKSLAKFHLKFNDCITSVAIENVAEQALLMLGLSAQEAQQIANLPLNFSHAPLFPLSAIKLLAPLKVGDDIVSST
jgi:hypothetical protein